MLIGKDCKVYVKPGEKSRWRMKSAVLPLIGLLCLAAAHGMAAEPRLIPFQGRLALNDGNPVADGRYLVQFMIYDAPIGGNVKWDGELHEVAVSQGIFSVTLGARALFLRDNIFNQVLHLETTLDINGDGIINAADPPMKPRQMIVPVVFAQDTALVQDRAWSDFFNIPGGTVSEARAKDAQRLDGMSTSDIFTSPLLQSAPVARHALLADRLTGSLILNGNMTLPSGVFLFGSSVRQMVHLFAAAYGIGVQGSTLYFRTGQNVAWHRGGEHSDTAFDPGQGGVHQMSLSATGQLGVSIQTATAEVDIGGDSTGANSLRLRSGDNSNENADSNQFLFSYNGGDQFTHAIKSRHHSGQTQGNSLDFLTWRPADGVGAVGTNHALSINGGRVGIGGIQSPTAMVDVGGDFKINGNQPIFVKYCGNAGNKNQIDTGIPVADYNVGVIGFRALQGDLDEKGVKSIIIQVYPDPSGINWSINADFASHSDRHETWHFYVIAVSTAISRREGF